MNTDSEIHIGRMRLRVLGTSKQDGLAVARRLQERIGNLSTGAAAQHIGFLHLRVPVCPGSDPGCQADSVASAVSNRLARSQQVTHA